MDAAGLASGSQPPPPAPCGGGGGAGRPPKSTKIVARLTCEMCRQRKTKCDKLNPCTSCQRLGISCVAVERPRLPRGRHRGAQASAPAPTAQADAGAASTAAAGGSLVLPLRPSRTDSISPAATSFTDSLVFTAEPELQTPLPDPLEGRDWAKVQLVQIFLDRIDPVFKVLHRPSVSLHLIQGKSYLDYEPGHPAVVALDRAIFHAAACAMDENECVPVFDMGKKAALAGLRVAIETALARAGLLSTEDITVLQAFVLYLVAMRTYDRTRQVWTLMSLAHRIAQALGLQIDPPPIPMKPFDIEMRRRLRYAIGLLDMQTSFDRLTPTIVPLHWMQTPYPANANDASFNLDSEGKLLDETGRSFTDMTFATLVARAQTVVRQINMTTQDGGAYGGLFQLHRGYVRDFRDAAIILLRHCRPDDDPFHWYVVQVTEWIIAQFHVAVERPLRRLPNYDPPRPDFSLLQVCAEILQRSQNIIGDSNVRFWNWSESVFNPWHALAVALAEICTCPDPIIVESYWDLVERAYAHSAELMERSRSEVSWGPMEKLMKKARAHRNSLLQAHGGLAGPVGAPLSSTSTHPPSVGSKMSHALQEHLEDQRKEFEDASRAGILPALSFLRDLTAEETAPSITVTTHSPLLTFQHTLGPETYGLGGGVSDVASGVGGVSGVGVSGADVSVEWATWDSFLNDLHVPEQTWPSNWT